MSIVAFNFFFLTFVTMKHNLISNSRRDLISFDKERHEYTYRDGRKFKGVTGWISDFKNPFDKEGASLGVARKEGISQAEVLARWDEQLRVSQDYGNGVHDSIEQMIATGEINPVYSVELENVLYALDHNDLTPIACEYTVYNEDVERASNIDLICERDGQIVLLDFKTPEKGIKFEAYKNQKMQYPVVLPDCSYYHYSLQLDIYAYWLESKYGMNVATDKYLLYLRGEEVKMYLTADVREQTLQMHAWHLKTK